MNLVSSKKLFQQSRRFDLIYKILYLEHIDSPKEQRDYYKKIYLESIKVFNGFFEDDKKNASDFIDAFENNYHSIKEKGFDFNMAIPVNKGYQLYDGAHRLAIAYSLGMDVPIEVIEHNDVFDYKFFDKRHISRELADIGTLEYVIHNENAHVVQVFPVVNRKMDCTIENILEEYGFIYTKKIIRLSYNALVNIKKINYGKEKWAGNASNRYDGLCKHAYNCIDYGGMRVYVFVCESIEKAVAAKKKIRSLFDMGNFPVHINDDHEEAVQLANIYFNKNGLDWLFSTPFRNATNQEGNVIELNDYFLKFGISPNEICVTGSGVLSAYGLRQSDDIDCISLKENMIIEYGNISSHESERRFYSNSFPKLICEHHNYFVISGIKYLSISNIARFKLKRHEFFKDIKDLFLIIGWRNARRIWYQLYTNIILIPVLKCKRIAVRIRKRGTRNASN